MRIVVFIVAWLASRSISATPFETALGATVADLEKMGITLEPQAMPYEYKMVLPNQNPEDTVTALITPENGLCRMQK